MIKIKPFLFVGVLWTSMACFAQQNTTGKTTDGKINEFKYTNPITRDTTIAMRDHCIIKIGEKGYCSGTSNLVKTGPNPGVRLLVSDDLIYRNNIRGLLMPV